MNEDWLDHQLTDDEAAQFERDGYLVIKGALSAEQTARLSAAVDRVSTQVTADFEVSPSDWYNLLDFLGLDDAFFELIDHPRTFPKLWRILGWNLQIYHAHMIVGPALPADGIQRRHKLQAYHPERIDTSVMKSADGWWGWHRDSGQVNGDLALGDGPHARLSAKFAYYLTDALGDDDGNMWVVPGSHLDPDVLPGAGFQNVAAPPGATRVHVAAGDAVLFDRRIVHSSSPNLGATTRQVLFYGYSHRWVRPRDEMTVDRYLDTCSPIQRQLLGHSHTAYGYTSPAPEDVPLRAWLENHGVLAA